MITTKCVDKLSHHRSAYSLCLKSLADLIELRHASYGPAWNNKCIVAEDEGKCVGVVLYTKEDEDDYLNIDYAYVDRNIEKELLF